MARHYAPRQGIVGRKSFTTFCDKCFQPIRDKILENHTVNVRSVKVKGKEYFYQKLPTACTKCNQWLPQSSWKSQYLEIKP